jgi:hypothetical protein
MQYTQRKLQRSVTEIRRSRNGRPSVSVTVIVIIVPRGGPAEQAAEEGGTRLDTGRRAAGPAGAARAGRGLPVELGAAYGLTAATKLLDGQPLGARARAGPDGRLR